MAQRWGRSSEAYNEAQRRRDEFNRWYEGWLRSLKWCDCLRPLWRRVYWRQRLCIRCNRLNGPGNEMRR